MNGSKIKTVAIGLLLACTAALQAVGQSSAFPNELPGYRFYGLGKLDGIRLGVSTKADVQRVFGESCTPSERCLLDDDWDVRFWYLSEYVTNDGVSYVPRPEYEGRVDMIFLEPKRNRPFRRYKFPKAFKRSTAAGSGCGTNGCTYTSYRVHFIEVPGGLQLEYRLFLKSNIRYEPEGRPRKGDLDSVVYSISDDRRDEMFVKQKDGN